MHGDSIKTVESGRFHRFADPHQDGLHRYALGSWSWRDPLDTAQFVRLRGGLEALPTMAVWFLAYPAW